MGSVDGERMDEERSELRADVEDEERADLRAMQRTRETD